MVARIRICQDDINHQNVLVDTSRRVSIGHEHECQAYLDNLRTRASCLCVNFSCACMIYMDQDTTMQIQQWAILLQYLYCLPAVLQSDKVGKREAGGFRRRLLPTILYRYYLHSALTKHSVTTSQ